MESAGLRLKQARERLKLRYRDVEEASQTIAGRRRNPEFAIALSRLSDIENKGTVPSLFRLYSLCAIYRLDLREVMGWYGVPHDGLAEAAAVPLDATHLAAPADFPGEAPPLEADGSRTAFLARLHRWGGFSAGLLPGFDPRNHRYGFVGLQDWTMHPLLEPGSLVLIDTRCRKIASAGWTAENDRPIYFLEHRLGYACGWCSLSGNRLILQPHPGNALSPAIFAFPGEIEVIGQVVGAATLTEARNWGVRPSSAARATSPDR